MSGEIKPTTQAEHYDSCQPHGRNQLLPHPLTPIWRNRTKITINLGSGLEMYIFQRRRLLFQDLTRTPLLLHSPSITVVSPLFNKEKSCLCDNGITTLTLHEFDKFFHISLWSPFGVEIHRLLVEAFARANVFLIDSDKLSIND